MAIIFHKHEAYLQRGKPVLERFWEKVDKTDGCWLWRSAVDKDGYGVFRLGGKNIKAHRMAFELSIGSTFDKLVCHKCDNPICVRPDHLFLGTCKDNILDCVAKKRNAFGDKNGTHTKPESVHRGEDINTAKLTESNVRFIRENCKMGTKRGASYFAKLFRMDKSTIQALIHHQTWKHIK